MEAAGYINQSTRLTITGTVREQEWTLIGPEIARIILTGGVSLDELASIPKQYAGGFIDGIHIRARRDELVLPLPDATKAEDHVTGWKDEWVLIVKREYQAIQFFDALNHELSKLSLIRHRLHFSGQPTLSFSWLVPVFDGQCFRQIMPRNGHFELLDPNGVSWRLSP